ncbi:YpbS family protein [Bacillus paralicheniformis]|uniref:YpbS family protein n=2 Tax=Bacillaceae TaxID=186817 RepID=UPI0013EEF54A|nr:YpbS family protein [Bacillus paralicheniformis]QII51611.1 YpbS family protein [Bacillus paralicheniformis]
MTNVHEAITAHSKKQHQHIKQFVRLEQEREKAIDEAVDKCRRNEAFSTDLINQITMQMNELAKKGIVPTRRLVSKEMVAEYVS